MVLGALWQHADRVNSVVQSVLQWASGRSSPQVRLLHLPPIYQKPGQVELGSRCGTPPFSQELSQLHAPPGPRPLKDILCAKIEFFLVPAASPTLPRGSLIPQSLLNISSNCVPGE